MDKKKIVEQVSELALPICEACGVELVDVEYVRERDWYLRVYICLLYTSPSPRD